MSYTNQSPVDDSIGPEKLSRFRLRPILRPWRLDSKISGCAISIGISIIFLGIVSGLMAARRSNINSMPIVTHTLTPAKQTNATASPTQYHTLAAPVLPTTLSVLPLPTTPLVSPTPTYPPQTPTPTFFPQFPTSTRPTLSPTPTATPLPLFEGPVIFGRSAGGRNLAFYRLGKGPSIRAIIGGIHGGYESNTTVFVSQTLTYLRDNPNMVPATVTLYIVPLLNPDGFVAGRDAIHGRMNGNGVDLNRNWDYQWQMTATHGDRPVSAGAYPFSEPETAALRDLLLDKKVKAAIVYHSGLAKIFSAADITRSATIELAEMMSEVTGYPHAPEGVLGQITTGDAIDWMSTQGITAIEVELTDHDDPEWERNIRGVIAFLNWRLDLKASFPTRSVEDIE